MIIESLTLYSKHLKDQEEFYGDTLGFEITASEKDHFSIKAGTTTLKFIQKDNATPYHFAFNIPGLKEEQALEWLKQRVHILKDGEQDIIDFPAWNARAIYFYDKDRNIVEFIARKHFSHLAPGDFGINSILEVAEIGLATDDIEQKFKQLKKHTGLEIYSGDFERFCAIGSDNGLFICINRNLKDWFPTNDKAYMSSFIISIMNDEKKHLIELDNDELKFLKR